MGSAQAKICSGGEFDSTRERVQGFNGPFCHPIGTHKWLHFLSNGIFPQRAKSLVRWPWGLIAAKKVDLMLEFAP